MIPVIIGYGVNRVGEYWNKDLVSIAYDAAKSALNIPKLHGIDAIYIGNMLGMSLDLQGHLGGYLADELGFNGLPSVRIEAAGASGSYAIVEAAYAIKAGVYDFILAGGVEKMSDALPKDLTYALNFAEDMYIMNYTGLTTTGLNALLMRLYMDRYKVPKEMISYLAVQDHANAVNSSHAQFRSPINIELVMSSPIIADPITLFDGSPVGDGSAFVVVTSKEKAEEMGLEYVEIAGAGISTNMFSVTEREDPLWFNATEQALSKALLEADLSKSDIDVCEIYDEYTITGVLTLESLGFFDKGKAAEAVSSGEASLNGRLPINTFGGLKARGNPIGATAAYEVAEVFMQLMNRAGENQVSDAKVGLIHSIGGLDNTSVVLLLRR